MSRLGCKCGHTMGSSECPSPYTIHVYYSDEVDKALAYNPRLRLMDFIMNWDDLNDCAKKYSVRTDDIDKIGGAHS